MQGPGLFEPIHGSAPDIAGQVEMTSISKTLTLDGFKLCLSQIFFPSCYVLSAGQGQSIGYNS
jgi:hypothetical protein